MSERQFLYRHLVDVGMFPAHKMWPNVGVHMVGSESNRIRRAQKQSEGPRFFARLPFIFPSSIFYRRSERLEQAKQNVKKKTTTTTKHKHKCRVKVSSKSCIITVVQY